MESSLVSALEPPNVGCLCLPPNPEGPCTYRATTWPLKGLPYHECGAYVYTMVVLGPAGKYPKKWSMFPRFWDKAHGFVSLTLIRLQTFEAVDRYAKPFIPRGSKYVYGTYIDSKVGREETLKGPGIHHTSICMDPLEWACRFGRCGSETRGGSPKM